MTKTLNLSTTLFIFTLYCLSLTNLAAATEEVREFKMFCMWKASAAQTIAMNRDIGVNESEIISFYLNQDDAYNEQVVVLNLIDKIYGNYEFVSHDTIFTQTNETCVRDLYIDRTSEFYLTQQVNDSY